MPALEAARLRRVLDWAENEIRRLRPDDARELAITLIVGAQGAALLTNALRDPNMTTEVRHLEPWIDTLAATPASS